MKRHNKVNLWATHTSTVLSITLVLFMLGLLLMIEYHTYRVGHDMKEKITFKVDLQQETSDSTALALKQEIASMSYVKHVDYISKEEAAEMFAQDLGEDFVGFIGYNPLYPSLMVNLKSEILPNNPMVIRDQFTKSIKAHSEVTGITYQEDVVNDIYDGLNKASWLLIGFIIILLIVCMTLISNTIRISLYGERETIKTMTLVGAKNSFIARPFLWRSLFYGFLGGLIADILLIIAIYSIDNQFQMHLMYQEHYIWYAIIMTSIIVVGLIISWIATRVAVRHHIRENY